MTMPAVGLGVIVPSGNTVLEVDLPGLALPGVRFHFTRVHNSEDTEAQLAAMKDEAGRAAWLLSHAPGVRAVAFACTGGSFVKGIGYDAEIAAIMRDACGLPCVTTSGAVVAALRALGITRPAMFSPYEEWLARRGAHFLADNGFAVAGLHWLSIATPEKMTRYNTPAIAAWIGQELRGGCDGIFISCTNFSWIASIAEIEVMTGLPVVSSNSATLWALLGTAGVEASVPGGGRLLAGGTDAG